MDTKSIYIGILTVPISVKYITNKLLNDLNKKFFLHLGPPKNLGDKK